ncbi:hypothetical protein [Dyadobacter fanqingshengii]|uniref:Peptidase MA-like domain-containing protein n=1 Tax=Dyadobacter fanqingshengii TaxID=2906443 RepID=A0A9X1P8S3_9BACT|nr:hypothetical protein [Dyadobacter fanqingshengii]MCF0039764.1 hypothetical protein [Dyadobacter fanqingshengii]USJ38473.2 hypothetical protein NFI81_11960 [Dyadobacter fanqingshengii]
MRMLLFIFLAHSATAFAQNTNDWRRYDDLLRQGKFDRVYAECKANLNEPYGKTSYLNHYYIGQSLCGKGYVKQGIVWYQYIRQKFPIDRNFAFQLTQSISKCGSNLTAPAGTTVTVIINNSVTPSGVTGGVRGKSGFQMDCDKDTFENYEKLRTNDTLSRRVFPKTKRAEALASLRRFLPDNLYKIDTAGRFMLVYSHSTEGSAKVQEVAASLESAYHFFVKKYRLKDIDKLFTVYLVDDKYSLGKLAKRVHDITIARGNIGYSSLNDLSLLGIANTKEAGTMVHELFHLMIRSDIGDISPWLDEGIACMYSVYDRNGNDLMGSYNTWRVTHFRMLINLTSQGKIHVPSLDQLVNYTWNEYQGETYNSFCDASVNYALSNFFALYLQYKNRDNDVIQAFKNRHSSSKDTLSPGPTDIALLEDVFGMPMNRITDDFYQFLERRYKINMADLLKKRPTYANSDLPARFQTLLDSVEVELAFLSKSRNTTATKELKALTEEKTLLFRAVASRQRQLTEHREEVIGLLSQSSSSENRSSDYRKEYEEQSISLAQEEKEYEFFLTKAEKQSIELIAKLKSKRQSYLGQP